MKKLIRNSVFASAIAVTGMNFTPLLASPMPQYQNQRGNDQDQDQNRDRDRDRSRDHDRDQTRDHDRDRDRDRAVSSGDESAYSSNQHFKEGWEDGMHHKHKNRKFDNDDDRRAYEAGYAHGDRGEKWQNPRHDDDRR